MAIYETRCCVVGGGPAGLMTGYLLARAGVDVVILEKHADFLRDFRGDTVHPSTLDIMDQIGLLDRFLTLPHQKVPRLSAQFGDEKVNIADFSHLPVRETYIALMPQWDFLNFLAEEGARYPGFRLFMETQATGLIEKDGTVVGVRTKGPGGTEGEIRADLVIGADGRGSRLREDAGLESIDAGAPMDALWFRLPHRPSDSEDTMGRFGAGTLLVLLYRGDYWQCAYVIPKGEFESLKAGGLEAFRSAIAAASPFEAERMNAIRTWDDVNLLTVRVDRLKQWYRPGFLAIGDAAHAMSPIGGVGVNLAVQDAVAAANRLARPLTARTVTLDDLRAVQQRRELPTRVTQRLQLVMQNRIVAPTLRTREAPKPPLAVRLMQSFPILQRIPARILGLGVRRERVADFIVRAGS
ncbi:monooxygenase [Hyphomicrobium nitrativorans NL23]|uniref:Monooxygenase n=1 Tax=Hyphomicrobium nitrativorans NL23 TaxID=1029756 RepID=V5SE78_9HYPH|nr:FAD-dependent oxidoreductase [Hyphomicrobium nitrativorans]AHB48813.1 monooxygenase [Hyphomicrobium nitrativorans NL23]